ncbi:hypothetical protein [Halioxenophilus sp. WMMB6]|uniref:hypothetical protein n=1 Tax=Halioxenophilus sp. WMMB6 TaxID=3073815 RepID=UPI00295E840F|nr:hypothetical protein [Halioxenophilus sp. WMMB6]
MLALCSAGWFSPLHADEPATQFLPDYIYRNANTSESDILGKGLDRHFSAYGLDNEDLDQAAANFADNRLNTTQRLLNHQWIYNEYHDVELEKGSRIFTEVLKAGARAYWSSYHSKRLKSSSVLPDGNGVGQLNEVRYKMRLKSDAVNVVISYEF